MWITHCRFSGGHAAKRGPPAQGERPKVVPAKARLPRLVANVLGERKGRERHHVDVEMNEQAVRGLRVAPVLHRLAGTLQRFLPTGGAGRRRALFPGREHRRRRCWERQYAQGGWSDAKLHDLDAMLEVKGIGA